jgi:putative endonuclease
VDRSAAYARHSVRGTRFAAILEAMRGPFYVYILASRYRGTLYVGVTNDLSRRMGEHKGGVVPGFTSKYGVQRLVYFEEFPSILEARAREHTLKRRRRQWKIALIEGVNPRWLDLTPDLAAV